MAINALSTNSSTVGSTELIFLGTGTSSSLPQIGCITAPPDSDNPPCRTCLSTLTPEGKKNIRRNTSAALRVTGKGGQPVTIVIDAGKNFQAAALEWFPKYGLRKIDALLITHAHADAMNGLDDLRGWTLRGIIQDHIDVYVSLDTFNEVKRCFPYLVAKEFASGGGDVPEFKFHIIHDQVPFEIGETGVTITPFSVHHGRLFSTVEKAGGVSLAHQPTNSGVSTPNPIASSISIEPEAIERIYPYIAFGFKIEEQVIYISDVSHIPEEAWPLLESGGKSKAPVVVLDCLRLRPHTSHVGLEDSVKLAKRMGASRTYFTGFGHEVSHDEWVRLGEIMGGASFNRAGLTEEEQVGLELMGEERGLWFRPSFDGLRVCISSSGDVEDDVY
ncbi:beta-lactamase-like protein [Coprinopsis sp. MPI-PUGE-AT-0042]|nr:beta-lactamase-like protein [Coprinopsis sp. MPI-PUGE-AT-0042]